MSTLDITHSENITHSERWPDIGAACTAHRERLEERRIKGELSYLTAAQSDAILDELANCPLGRHILSTGGANGFWTDYMISYPKTEGKREELNPQEDYIIFDCLSVVAQRELFLKSQEVAQKHLKDGCILVSLPCGVMRDLLDLNFSAVKNYTLMGIDLDSESLESAKMLAEEKKVDVDNVRLIEKNAWEFVVDTQVDFINSIGLNVYESNRERVIALYKQFYQALKPNGVLFTGVLTYPPGHDKPTDWNLASISNESLEKDKILVEDILNVQFQNYRTRGEMKDDFFKAGFAEVEIIPDKNCIFPSIIATKRLGTIVESKIKASNQLN